MTEIFPIHIRSNNQGHVIGEFRAAYLAARTPKMDSWFCFDVLIRSRTEVTFIVFGMWSNVSGGKGEEKYRFDAVVSPELTASAIERKIVSLATDRRLRELDAAENRIIDGYADEIRAELEMSV